MSPAPSTTRLPPRWTWNSLRLRTMLAILAWVALGIGGIWFSATRLFAKHVEAQYHEELEVHIVELAGLVQVGGDGRLSLIRPLSDPRYLMPLSGFYWQVNIDGGPSLRSASMTRGKLDEGVAHSAHILHHVESGPTGPAITYGMVRREPNGRLVHYVIATDQKLLDTTIGAFTRELLVWLGILAATLVGTGFAVVTFGLRPLDRLARAISRLRGGDSDSLRGRYPSEIAPLVEDLNAFIVHNSKSVERGRVEASNLAHALRTPLAVMIDEAERLALRPEAREAAHVFLDQARLMAQHIEFRLARASFAAAGGLPGAVSKIPDVLPRIISAMQRLHPDVAFKIEGDVNDAATLPVDPVDLTELLSNLLDNAGKWANDTVTITVTGETPCEIMILDDGPGLSPEQMMQACEVGMRFDEATPGFGLGLAIARDIAHSYGLDLTLRARPDGKHGLCAHVSQQSA